jgi:Uma2 family endonuclease
MPSCFPAAEEPILRGELFVTPAPGWRHQQAVVALVALLREYLERTGLGRVAVAPR